MECCKLAEDYEIFSISEGHQSMGMDLDYPI